MIWSGIRSNESCVLSHKVSTSYQSMESIEYYTVCTFRIAFFSVCLKYLENSYRYSELLNFLRRFNHYESQHIYYSTMCVCAHCAHIDWTLTFLLIKFLTRIFFLWTIFDNTSIHNVYYTYSYWIKEDCFNQEVDDVQCVHILCATYTVYTIHCYTLYSIH